ncbi:unnamed protein product, partial [Prorocentrum cordatum]
WAAALEAWGREASDACAPYLEKIPGFGKKKKKKAGEPTAAAGFEPGKVGSVQSKEHLDSLLAESVTAGHAVVLDFTASWCKPCQAMKPRFEALAAQYSSHCFAEVDADEQDDVSAQCEVMGLPTFQVFLAGKRVASITGAGEEKLDALVAEHLGAPGGQGDKKTM